MKQEGTADAVKCALPYLEPDDRVLIVNGDMPLLTADTIKQLLPYPSAILVTIMLHPHGYGRVITDGEHLVAEIREEKMCSPEERAIKVVNVGVYMFRGKSLIDHIPRIRKNVKSGEYYLTDLLAILYDETEEEVVAVFSENPVCCRGVNTLEELNELSTI
jgi:bifunctional UDP-N-acetylglucosamine pyrophosphorylase/glucosamine-1-phosphate N-acetyltransferase